MVSLPIDRSSLHKRYAGGTSPLTVVDACLDAIARCGDAGIFLHLVDPGEARRVVANLPPFDPARYPLWGLPFAIKDNIDLAGSPTTAACPAFSYRPSRSSTVVEKLVAAGAVPIGKTNLDQFATGLVGVRSPHPVPRNPFDSKRVPGGSSSGSAVAVARGLVTFALGTDTAGSGRVPAGLNNIVGVKPTVGLLSTRGVVPACRTLDCVSIFSATVEDGRAVLDCAKGYDEEDPYSRKVTAHDQPLRVLGIPQGEDLQFFGDDVMAAAWTAAIERLAAAGVKLVPIAMKPFFDVARLLYEGPWVAERRAAVGDLFDRTPDALHPVTRKILAGAANHTAVDAFNAFYRLAALRRDCELVLATIDGMVVPTAPIFPTLSDLDADPIGPNSRLGTYTNFVNLLDLSAIAVPGPFRSDGLPAGLTFIGPPGSDHALCDLGRTFFSGVGGVGSRATARVA